MGRRRLTGTCSCFIYIVWCAHDVLKNWVNEQHPVFEMKLYASSVPCIVGNEAPSPLPANCTCFTHDFSHDRGLWSHLENQTGWNYKVLVTHATDCLAGAVAAQVPHRRRHPWVGELWWGSVSCRTSPVLLWGLCTLTLSFLRSHVKGCG